MLVETYHRGVIASLRSQINRLSIELADAHGQIETLKEELRNSEEKEKQ